MLSGSALVAFALASASPGFAGVAFTVNSTLDLPDATPLGDGIVDADLGTPGDQITLRAAIQETNHLWGADTISLPPGIFALTQSGTPENHCLRGDLDVRDELAISGSGSDATFIDGNAISERVFHVKGARCTYSGLTVRRGKTINAKQRGGGILVESNAWILLDHVTVSENVSAGDGGGIAVVSAQMQAWDSLVEGNQAASDGGGIALIAAPNQGSSWFQIYRCTLRDNVADGDGGAVFSSNSDPDVVNSTVSGNEASRGGALAVQKSSGSWFTNTTIARNKAPIGSGIFSLPSGSAPSGVVLLNSIVANKKNTNFHGSGLNSHGHNIDSGSTCKLYGPGDKKKTNPLIGLLKDNGGPTPTIGLLAGSPAIDAGDDQSADPNDQRNMARINIPGIGKPAIFSDIGAFERQTP